LIGKLSPTGHRARAVSHQGSDEAGQSDVAVIASSFGLRFQRQGYFLTDARKHRGTSGAPVVMRASEFEDLPGELP